MAPLDRNPGRGFMDGSSGYEERLQTLESKQNDMNITVAQQAVTLVYINQTLEKGFASMQESLKPLTVKLGEIDKTMEDHKEFIDETRKHQEKEEKEADEAKKAKRGFWMKILASGLAATAGGAGLFIWEHVLSKYLTP